MYPFRVFVFAEDISATDKKRLEDALVLLKKDYQKIEGWDLEWTTSYDFKPDWILAWTDTKLLSGAQLLQKTRWVKEIYGEQFHSVMFVIKDWQANYGGINLENFYSGMSVQMTKWYNNVSDLWSVIGEEFAHALDEQIERELGIDIEQKLGIEGDVDDIFVHGLKYLDYSKGIRRPEFDYMAYYSLIAPLIVETCKRRYDRWYKELKMKVSLLGTIVGLLGKTLFLYREIKKKKEPHIIS